MTQIKLSQKFLPSFWTKCVNSGVPRTNECLGSATKQANKLFAESFEECNLINQSLFINQLTVSYNNGIVTVK